MELLRKDRGKLCTVLSSYRDHHSSKKTKTGANRPQKIPQYMAQTKPQTRANRPHKIPQYMAQTKPQTGANQPQKMPQYMAQKTTQTDAHRRQKTQYFAQFDSQKCLAFPIRFCRIPGSSHVVP